MQDKPSYHFQKAPYQGFVAENNCCGFHLHRQVEISYVTDGEQIFYIDDVPYLIKPGDLIIVFPNQIHYLDTPEYCKAITSIFDPFYTSDFTDFFLNYHFDNCVFHKEELSETTLSALNALAKTGISKSYKLHPVPYLEKGFLTVILADLFNLHELIPYTPLDSAYIITAFFNYVENNLNQKLTIPIIAKELGISSSKLSDCITKNTGNTPHALINIRRLDRARTMLYKTNKPIAEIAVENGFSSERTFFRNFKEMYQKTPLEFRNKKAAARINTEFAALSKGKK